MSSRRRRWASSIDSGNALEEDPSLVAAFSSDGFTALHYAGFFGKAEAAHILIEAGAAVGRLYEERVRPTSRCTPPLPGDTTRSVGSCCRRAPT